MRVTAQDVPALLSLTIDQALELALQKAGEGKTITNEVYQELLSKLGVGEGETFTLGLASNGIAVLPDQIEVKMASVNIDNLKRRVLAVVQRDGCLYEDEYYEICQNAGSMAIGELNTWLMAAQVTMRKNPPRKSKNPLQDTDYRKKVKNIVRHPDIRKLSKSAGALDKYVNIHGADSLEEVKKAYHFMQLIVNDYETATELAENTAWELDHDEWLDDETHWIWVMAFDVQDENLDQEENSIEANRKIASLRLNKVINELKDEEYFEEGKTDFLAPWVSREASKKNAFGPYTDCACKDCFATAVGEDPVLCKSCEEAGCSAAGDEPCHRKDVYGDEELRRDEQAFNLRHTHSRKMATRTASTKVADIRLTPTDKACIEAFIDQKDAEGTKVRSEGGRLDIIGMGGRGLAEWVDDKIYIRDLGTRSEQTVVHYLKKNTPNAFWGGNIRSAGIEDLPAKKDTCPECGTPFEYEDKECIECGMKRDQEIEAGCDEEHKKTAQELMQTPDEYANLPDYLYKKLTQMKAGERVVLSDEGLDLLEALYDVDPDIRYLRTLPNPRQMGTKDKWIGFISENTQEINVAKKTAQRIDEEKRQLEDAIRSRQSQLPNWKKLLDKVRKAFDFSELKEIWDVITGTPAYAKKGNLRVTADDLSSPDSILGKLTEQDWEHIKQTAMQQQTEWNWGLDESGAMEDMPEEIVMTSIGYVTVGLLDENVGVLNGFNESIDFNFDGPPVGSARRIGGSTRIATDDVAAPDSSEAFIETFKSNLSIGDRQIHISNKSMGKYNAIFITLINLPQGVGGAGGGAEAENNRMMFSIWGFDEKDPKAPAPAGKVKIEHRVNALSREYNLRGKTGSPEKIAKYLADHINKVVAEVEPHYTHTTPPSTPTKADPVEAHIQANTNSFDKVKVILGNSESTVITAYVANDDIQKIAGLEVFDKLDEKEGMLFPFGHTPQRVMFHMGKVKFPIDILFLMDNGLGNLTVKKVISNAQPGTTARWSANDITHVLELSGGMSEKLGVKIGSVCSIG